MLAHVDEVVVEAGEGGPRAQRYPAPVRHAAVGGPANSVHVRSNPPITYPVLSRAVDRTSRYIEIFRDVPLIAPVL